MPDQPDDPVAAALLALKAAKSDDCRKYWRRKVAELTVDGKIQRNEYAAIIFGPITPDIREALILSLLRQECS